MNLSGTVDLARKKPSHQTELFVGKISKVVIAMDENTQNSPIGDLTIPDEVREFLEGILKDANMTYADEAMHEELINELFARLDNYMTSVLVDTMPAEKLDEFIKMNGENKNQEEIEDYIKTNIPNSQDVLTKAFMNFRDMYLTGVTVARNAPQSEDGDQKSTASAEGSGESKEDGSQMSEDGDQKTEELKAASADSSGELKGEDN